MDQDGRLCCHLVSHIDGYDKVANVSGRRETEQYRIIMSFSVKVSEAQMVKKKKKSACNAGNPGWIPGSGRYPGEGNDNPLQYSCLENEDPGGLQSIGSVSKSRTRLSG